MAISKAQFGQIQITKQRFAFFNSVLKIHLLCLSFLRGELYFNSNLLTFSGIITSATTSAIVMTCRISPLHTVYTKVYNTVTHNIINRIYIYYTDEDVYIVGTSLYLRIRLNGYVQWCRRFNGTMSENASKEKTNESNCFAQFVYFISYHQLITNYT